MLRRGDVSYGAMLSIWTAGMALGALLLSPRVAAYALATVGLAAATTQGLAPALPALWLSFAFLLACRALGIKHIRTRLHRPRPTARPSASSALVA